MSESRYPIRVSDPDQTTRIPKEALEGLRDADADKAREASRSGTGSSAHDSSSSKSPNGSPGARSGGYSSDGSASSGGSTRSSLFGSGSGAGAAAGAAGGGAGANGIGGYSSPAGVPPVPSPIGYPERSQTGYSPAAYQGSYSSAYPSMADAPTSVAGRGVGRSAAGAAGATAAARASLSAAARPSPGTTRGAPGGRPPRRARLLVRHIDPWSTLKFSFVLSVAMFFVWLVAVGVLYGVLDGMGVFSQINKLYDEVSGNAGDRLFSPALVLGSATVVGAVNIVLFTALATIGAFVYNICSDLVGGIEVTLAERD